MKRESRVKISPQRQEEKVRERFLQKALKNVPIPAFHPPTPEDLARRRQAAAQIDRFRAKLGPLPFSVTELIREDRDEAGEEHD